MSLYAVGYSLGEFANNLTTVTMSSSHFFVISAAVFELGKYMVYIHATLTSNACKMKCLIQNSSRTSLNFPMQWLHNHGPSHISLQNCKENFSCF